MLWDRGTWEPLDDPHEGLKKGKLHFRLHGERLKGGWALVRMPPRGKEKRENWLLIKERDEYADEADPLLEKNTTSVDDAAARWRRSPTAIPPSGTRTAPAAAAPKPRRARGAPRRETLPLPEFRPPQLATLVEVAAGRRRLGARAQIRRLPLLIAANGAEVRCYTRSGQDWTEKFRADRRGVRARWTCRRADRRRDRRLHAGRAAPISPRCRRRCRKAARSTSSPSICSRRPARTSPSSRSSSARTGCRRCSTTCRRTARSTSATHIVGDGDAVLAADLRRRPRRHRLQEGDRRPIAATRTKTWLKIKCGRRQEFVIGGWTPSDKRTRLPLAARSAPGRTASSSIAAASAPASTTTT